MRILLISCGKSKRDASSPAGELYTGGLFRAAAAHAEALGHPWAILSARHGLLLPGQLVEPYEHRLRADEAEGWAGRVAGQIQVWAPDLGLRCRGPEAGNQCRIWDPAVWEIHAGRDYTDPLMGRLTRSQWTVEAPLAGLQVGERLAWYKRAREAREPVRQVDLFGAAAK